MAPDRPRFRRLTLGAEHDTQSLSHLVLATTRHGRAPQPRFLSNTGAHCYLCRMSSVHRVLKKSDAASGHTLFRIWGTSPRIPESGGTRGLNPRVGAQLVYLGRDRQGPMDRVLSLGGHDKARIPNLPPANHHF